MGIKAAFDFTGRTVLVVGASRGGIGSAIAAGFQECGALVRITGAEPEPVALDQGRYPYAQLDVADPFAVQRLADSLPTVHRVRQLRDIGSLTLEGQFHLANLERTSREATKGDDDGFAVAAVYRAKDWLDLRASYDQAKRPAEGETLFGFQSDEAERETKRTGINVEFTLPKGVELGFANFRRDVEYPNRPDRIAQSGGVPVAGAQPIPNTPSGLLEAKYDSFTAEIGYFPSEKVELGAYYTYEKDATTNQWSTTTGVALNNLLNYAGTDETDTFGLNASFQLKPEVWRLSLNAMRQKVDGLMDITAREAGFIITKTILTIIQV